MPYFGPNRPARILAAAIVIPLVAGALVSGVSLIQASRTAAEHESGITAAHASQSRHEEALRSTLESAVGIQGLTVADAKRAAGIALRRQGDDSGGRLAVIRLKERYGQVARAPGQRLTSGRIVSPEMAATVATAATQYVAKAAVYQTQLAKARSTYALELDSEWSGMWMRMAGYPKIDLSPAKPRLALPAVAKPAKENLPETADASALGVAPPPPAAATPERPQ